MTKKSIVVKDITKEYLGDNDDIVVAVDNLSIDIEAGSLTTLLGPSGCGKTTMLRLIAGFEIPTSGEIYIGDKEVALLTPDKRDTAMVFQSYALFPHLNVYDNIAYGLKIKKLDKKLISEKVDNVMNLIGLKEYADRAPNKLSGGQQQRVALARALVMEPSVLLFDEPLSNLDAKLRISMRNEIRRIQQEFGTTAIYVTHDQSEAMSISDTIIVMKDGRIEQIGSPEEIYQRPNSVFVADFIGQANVLDATVKSAEGENVTVEVAGHLIKTKYEKEVSVDELVKLVIRPESVTLEETGEIEVEVVQSIFMGASHDYDVLLNGNKLSLEVNDPEYKKVYNTGEKAYINLNEKNVRIVKK